MGNLELEPADSDGDGDAEARNVYRLQAGGVRLCAALRQIADGCDSPEQVAEAALKHKAPDPDWSIIATRLEQHPGQGELVLLDAHIQRCRDAVAECPKWSAAQAEWSRARDALLNFRDELLARADAPVGEG